MQKLPLTVKTVLLGAADLLRKRGWTRQQMERPDGHMCLVGAIRRFVVEAKISDCVVASNLIDDATQQLNFTIWNYAPNKPHATRWNDVDCTGADQAIAMLERAAGAA